MYIIGWVFLLGAVTIAVSGYAPPLPPCLEYGGCRQHHHSPFVPAPPGKTPDCATHGNTFCENIDQYPKQLIRYLVDHWIYDYRTLLSDESKNDFPKSLKAPKPIYGPPPPSLYPTYYAPPPPLAGNSINYTQDEGYPDRRYTLPTFPHLSNDPELVYSALLRPDITPYDPSHWWKRHTRSKRQVSGQETELCPIRSQFINPRAALNSQGNWMYVVNLEQDQNRFTQQVRAEICIRDQCGGLCSLPNGYTSRCQQQYVQKRLVALEGSGNQLYTDTFWLPHCCICQITLSGNG